MRRFTVLIATIVTLTTLSGCTSVAKDIPVQPSIKTTEELKYSDNILLSVNSDAAGYGTLAECTDATIVIYTDRTIKVFMNTEASPEIAVLEMSVEDYEKLTEFAQPEKISQIQVESDMEACDGSSYYITLYDENDAELLYIGGYMPIGDEFWETYKAIKDILEPYEIEEVVDTYRETM